MSTDRRLTIIPEKRITIPYRVRQIVPVVGAALVLTWGIGKALAHVRQRRQITHSRIVIYRRLTIRLERPLRAE
jgi:hypothetical protein